MSRLYDALAEATRFRHGSNRKPSFWEGGIPEIEIPPVEPAVEVAEDASRENEKSKTEAAPLGVEATPVSEGMPTSSPTVLNGFSGASTAASLDRRARLIPHAVDGVIVEHYRRLRTKILQKREETPFRTLLVTSANPQEGKSVTALNLGLSFAMLPGFKVLVIDGDLRRGSLGQWLRVPEGQPGLGDVVNGSARLEDVVLQARGIPMHFMVRGNSRVTDVHTSQFGVLFRKLAEHFDLIIVDSPPVNLLADVQLLAGACQAVLLVARSFVTSRQALEKAVQDLQPFNVIGTVLNASEKGHSRYYYGYY